MAETQQAEPGAATEGNGTGGEAAAAAAAPAAAEAAKSNLRQYAVFTEQVIDLNEDPAAIIEKLKTIVGKDHQNNPIPSVTVLVRVGRAKESDPKKAIQAVGDARDLQGDYEVIADSARNKYPGVTSAVRRVVSIG